jgi:hypothetical protein
MNSRFFFLFFRGDFLGTEKIHNRYLHLVHCFTAGISSPSLHKTAKKIIIYFSLSGQVCFCLQREEGWIEELTRLGFLTVDYISISAEDISTSSC